MSKRKKEIRKQFRDAVFERDGHKCAMCKDDGFSGLIFRLDAHHIIDRNELNNGGYIIENGITLCPYCHLFAEIYHNSNGQKWHPGYHPDDLFKKIGSSREKVVSLCGLRV